MSKTDNKELADIRAAFRLMAEVDPAWNLPWTDGASLVTHLADDAKSLILETVMARPWLLQIVLCQVRAERDAQEWLHQQESDASRGRVVHLPVRPEVVKPVEQPKESPKEPAIHARGRDGRLTLCPAGADTSWIDDLGGHGRPAGSVRVTVTVTNTRSHVTCSRCRSILAKQEANR